MFSNQWFKNTRKIFRKCRSVYEKSVFLQPQKRGTLFERQTQSQADIAQLVEQLICNQPVGGSSPSIGSKFFLGESHSGNCNRL